MPARVLAVAFDACEMDLVLPWAACGRLPSIGALLHDAASVETRSAPGLFAGAVWPSIPPRPVLHAARRDRPAATPIR
jgi:hypothetical protein